MSTRRDKHQGKMHRNAAKAPTWLRTGAAAHYDPIGYHAFRNKQLGTFGPASEVRRIDPKTGEAAQ